MANPMTAREAWEIVRTIGGRYTQAQYEQARNIMHALVEAHESFGEMSDYDVPLAVAKVRALERGDETRKDAP